MTSGIILLKRENAEFSAGYGLLKQDLSGLSEHMPLLHTEERNYLSTLKYNRRKQSYLLGRIACKKALSGIMGQTPSSVFVDFGIFQFPVVKYVRDLNIQVSISHCENIGLALAFPEAHPLGIDIEKIDNAKTEAMESQMTAREKTMISGMDLSVPIAYTILWTIKESLSKILKTGLMTDFKYFEIQSLTATENGYESVFVHHGQYKAVSYVLAGYACTIVLPKNTKADLDAFRNALHRIAV